MHRRTWLLATGSLVLLVSAGVFQACGGDTTEPIPDAGGGDAPFNPNDGNVDPDVNNPPPPDDAGPDVVVDAGPLCTSNPCVVGLAVGGHHACALLKDGSVRCWGANQFGQLGNGSDAGFDASARNTPVAVNGLSGVQSVSAATVYTTAGHTCARTGSGTFCWGVNSSGQLGQTNDAGAGIFDNQPHPSPLTPSGVTASSLTTSNNFNSCAIVGTDMICWGLNQDGANGRGGVPSNTVSGPGKILLGDGGAQVASGSIGSEFGLALLKDGTVLSWGRNTNNALARTTGQQVDTTPAPIAGLTDVVQVSAGEAHACAVNKTGQVLCWGLNDYGQLGRGTTGGNSNLPFAVPLGTGKIATQVAASNAHTCAITTDGLVYCWGRNSGGQVGPVDGGYSPNPVTVPTEVKVGGKAIAIGTGGSNLNNFATGYTCVLLEGGAVQCWGFNGDGELGRGGDAGTVNCQVGACSPVPSNVVFQ